MTKQMNQEILVALIVTYNRKEKLSLAIEALLKSDVTSIVVVDNHSTDQTIEYLNELDSQRVDVVKLDENLGGSGGFFNGVKYIDENMTDYDWILFCDDDAFIAPDTIENFLNRERRDDIFGYMSAVYYPSGEVCDMNVPGFEPFKNFSQAKESLLRDFHLERSAYSSDELVRVDFASFVGLFVKRDVVKSLGYPDPEWFIYGDDLDYTLNMTKHNFPIYFDPKLKFIHDCETIDSQKRVYLPMWKAYFTYRNGLMIYRRLSGRFFPIVSALKFLRWLSNVRFYSDKKGYLKLLMLAMRDGLKGDRTKKLNEIKAYLEL